MAKTDDISNVPTEIRDKLGELSFVKQMNLSGELGFLAINRQDAINNIEREGYYILTTQLNFSEHELKIK